MLIKQIAVLIIFFSMVGCEERVVAVPADGGQDDGGQDDGGQDSGYLYTYCEDGQILTGRCTDGICDPRPFETCDDGSCVLAPATCKALPPSITITIENERHQTIYIDGLFMPFELRDSAGSSLATHTMINVGSCDQCEDICAESLPQGDPSPCYVELAAGAKATLSWNTMVFGSGSCAPSCDKTCSRSSRIEPGDYTVVIPYRLDLEVQDYTFTEVVCTSIQGGSSWMGDYFGFPVFDHQAEIAVTFDGQDEHLLSIK